MPPAATDFICAASRACFSSWLFITFQYSGFGSDPEHIRASADGIVPPAELH
jgi:hypothetical protein